MIISRLIRNALLLGLLTSSSGCSGLSDFLACGPPKHDRRILEDREIDQMNHALLSLHRNLKAIDVIGLVVYLDDPNFFKNLNKYRYSSELRSQLHERWIQVYKASHSKENAVIRVAIGTVRQRNLFEISDHRCVAI